MDAKITKNRLKELFSYDWLKIAACVMALIFAWVMIFELTETRIKPSQRFTVFNHMQNTTINLQRENRIKAALQDDAFSSEVMEFAYQDLNSAGMYSHETILSYLGVSDGDIMLVPNKPNPSSGSKLDNEGNAIEGEYKYTYPESLVNPYRQYIVDLNPETEGSYFYQLEAYLNSFYDQGWEVENSINTQKIEQAFRARVQQNKDKRYRTEALLVAAIPNEIERIKKYRDAYEKLCGWLDDGLIKFNEVSHVTDDMEGYGEPFDGILSLNICPDESRMDNLQNYYSVTNYRYSESGEIIGTESYTAQDMSVVFFHNPEQDASFEYEGLLYVVWLIEKGMTVVS